MHPSKQVLRFGLIGTVTHDVITREQGQSFSGLGGILYQASVLCSTGSEVHLFTNLGRELIGEFTEMTAGWAALHREGVVVVPGPGNRVRLHYPQRGEREEVLYSVVPTLNPIRVLSAFSALDFLILVVNSGWDLELEAWKRIKAAARCPLWLDIHSLVLERVLGRPRRYVSVKEWKEWIKGVNFIQANRAEVAALLEKPGSMATEEEILLFSEEVLSEGATAVFVTLGEEGVLVAARPGVRKIAAPTVDRVVDSTGCGDVFCAAAVFRLAEGDDPYTAARYGTRAAAASAGYTGIMPLRAFRE